MRCFLALELSTPARDHLAEVQRTLAPALPKASLPPPANLHLTLKFLGDVTDTDVSKVAEALKGLPPAGPIRLRAAALECFPPRGGAVRVVTAALEEVEGRGALARLHEGIESACHRAGFPREGRAFRPHVTLARARNPLPGSQRERLAELVKSAWPGPASRAAEFCLFESRLKPSGAEYAVVGRFPVEGG
jgi:RNA 2',3'-cyclic 3'-phosphodiesterase